jgi:hypothetical protein
LNQSQLTTLIEGSSQYEAAEDPDAMDSEVMVVVEGEEDADTATERSSVMPADIPPKKTSRRSSKRPAADDDGPGAAKAKGSQKRRRSSVSMPVLDPDSDETGTMANSDDVHEIQEELSSSRRKPKKPRRSAASQRQASSVPSGLDEDMMDQTPLDSDPSVASAPPEKKPRASGKRRKSGQNGCAEASI